MSQRKEERKMFWQITEVCLAILVGLVILTQMVLPPFIGKRFFWFFRKSEKAILEAQSELEDAEATVAAGEIRKQVERVKKTTSRKKTGGKE
jgi:hypothetical protein